MPSLNTGPWNSLEITKIIISALSTIVTAALAIALFIVGHRIDRVNAEQTRQNTINDKKIALWDKMGPKLNSILAYITYVGRWQSMTASQIVNAKRDVDETFYVYKPFFSAEFVQAYDRFMIASFQTYNGFGEDAKIKSSWQFRKSEDRKAFSDSYDLREVYEAYNELLSAAGEDFGLKTVKVPYTNRSPVSPVSTEQQPLR